LTASRRKLAELIRSDEIASSEFWNIFDTTLRIEVFDEPEIDIVLRKVPQVTWSKGARSELVNWSGAFPRLILALINEVVRTQDTGEIDAECVNRAAADSIDGVSSVLERLWSDCPSSARELYRRLDSEGPGKLPATHRPDIAVLSERGFIRREGDTWRASCRWLKQYLEENTSDLDCIPRLFGSPDLHRKNLKSVLDGRLSHLQGLDLQLGRYLDMLLSDIPDHPEDCLRNVRYYWDRAIALIWDAEFGRERTIPPDYLDYWKTCGETLMNKWSGPFPVGNKGHQMGLLDLLTGTQRSNPRAKFVSKNTSTLLSAALGYGNFGTHSEFYDVDLDLAHVAIHTCIEIAGRLTSELPR
jgi:hypothetical protein